jgi:hypothetical protein
MRLLVVVAISLVSQLVHSPASVACTKEEFAQAIDRAGEDLRRLNADNAPRLRAKLRQLKEARGWPDAGFEEKAIALIQDERTAALDTTTNDLLAKLDQLGTVGATAEPDCAQLQELTAISLELQAAVKAKAAYTLGKIDQMLAVGAVPPSSGARGEASEAGEAKKPPPAEPKPRPATRESGWSTETKGEPREVAIAHPPPPIPPAAGEEEGYTIDEVMAASAGFFGKVSANLAAVIEYLFKNSGRPTAYVLGTESGGAFLAGVRYGKGTLYQRSASATQKVYWHGPSLGTDVGAEGSKTLFLIYKMKDPDALFATFTGIDGSAYLVGGVGATLVTNGSVVLAPIRSGVGLRLGANVGYIRFTSHPTWNPF